MSDKVPSLDTGAAPACRSAFTAATGQGPTEPSIAAGAPAPLSLTDVDVAARLEGLHVGYSIVMPVDAPGPSGVMVYGSYQLSNAWPGRLSAEQTVYLDQFTGTTLARSDTSTFGALGQYTELGVLIHSGTQYGLTDRITMTAGVLLLLVSIATSLVMWWKRRPSRRIGLPRRPDGPAPAPIDGHHRTRRGARLPAVGRLSAHHPRPGPVPHTPRATPTDGIRDACCHLIPCTLTASYSV